MCQKCLDATNLHYPNLKEGEIGDLLMGATSFPFSTPERIESELIELKEKTDGTLGAAIAFADSELERQLSKLNKTVK